MKSETIPGSTDATGLFTAKSPYQAYCYEKGGTYEAKIKAFEILYPPLFCYNENNELVKGVDGLEVKKGYKMWLSKDEKWVLISNPDDYPGAKIEHIYRQVSIAVQPTEKALTEANPFKAVDEAEPTVSNDEQFNSCRNSVVNGSSCMCLDITECAFYTPATPLPEAQPLEGVKTAAKEMLYRVIPYTSDFAKTGNFKILLDAVVKFTIENAQFATDAGGWIRACLEAFVNSCYTGCSKQELEVLRQNAENALKAPSTHSSSEMVEVEKVIKSVEQLLVELQDTLHYQTYPCDYPNPIYKIEELKGDYFPLHMVKEVAEQYANQFKNK